LFVKIAHPHDVGAIFENRFHYVCGNSA
jgi:hypothetical protein